ncbi:MAG: M28 family peptidase [Bacteroidota bacterium]
MKTIAVLLVLFGVTVVLQAQETLPAIDKKYLKNSVKVLSSDSLQGRGLGTAGLAKAAKFIANEYQKMSLDHFDNDYLETFQLSRRYWDEVFVEINGQRFNNFEQIIFQGHQPQNTPVSKEIVFGGTGSEEELDQLDVEGRLVLVFVKNLRAAGITVNKRLSKRKAYGVLLANPDNDLQFSSIKRTSKNHALAKRYSLLEKQQPKDIPARMQPDTPFIYSISIPNDQVGHVMGHPVKELQKLTETNRITDVKPVLAKVQFKRVDDMVETSNVVGKLHGITDKTIVVSAHYDHLGLHHPSYYAGADDNASGVAAMLELARYFSSMKELRYNMVFMATSAEEKGLLGSEYHVNSTLFDSATTLLNINLDMIGRIDEAHQNGKYLYFLGSGQSARLDSLMTKADLAYNQCEIDYSMEGFTGIFTRSDHYHFYKKGVPSVMFFSGLHEDYHKTTDTADKISFKTLEKRVTQIAVLMELLQRDGL